MVMSSGRPGRRVAASAASAAAAMVVTAVELGFLPEKQAHR
jgi:hypothetical protein